MKQPTKAIPNPGSEKLSAAADERPLAALDPETAIVDLEATRDEVMDAPECASRDCKEKVDTPGAYWEVCRTVRIHGWNRPSRIELANNACVVDRCGQKSIFNLCKQHAIPGMVVQIEKAGKYVISLWLVARKDQKRLITLNDRTLGKWFDSREAFEKHLHEQGFGVHCLISQLAQLEAYTPGIVRFWARQSFWAGLVSDRRVNDFVVGPQQQAS